MREILFRGKRTDNGEWVYGDYQHFYTDCGTLVIYISDWGKMTADVIPETIGQYTGRKDINGVNIYEGDICLCDRNIGKTIDKLTFTIKYDTESCTYYGECNDLGGDITGESFELCEVIGNIHDNKLEVAE